MQFPNDAECICIDFWDEAFYQKALDWVGDERRVEIFSESERKSDHPRIKIHCIDSPLQKLAMTKKIAWSAVLQKLFVIGDEWFKQEIEKYHLAAHLILSEAADYWIEAVKNAKANQSAYRRGMALKGAFAGTPAVIIGAGPSLAKNGHLLKEWADKALLFAGGSALNTVDVEPHFAASIDAKAPYRQFKMHPFSETPFCYQARMNRENFSLIHGEKLLFPDSSSDLINWIYGEERFDGGWTVGNFLTAIALHLGCNPIIFVGMDLCYQQGRKYAKIDSDLPEGLIEARGSLTQKDWLMSAEWTEDLAKKHPLINASEGGILDLPRQNLEELLPLFSVKRNLRKEVHDAIQRLPLRSPIDRWDEWKREKMHETLLDPLWEIWKPVFEREVELNPEQKLEVHQNLFFQRVIEEYGSVIL
jgi:hypothetical protein